VKSVVIKNNERKSCVVIVFSDRGSVENRTSMMSSL